MTGIVLKFVLPNRPAQPNIGFLTQKITRLENKPLIGESSIYVEVLCVIEFPC